MKATLTLTADTAEDLGKLQKILAAVGGVTAEAAPAKASVADKIEKAEKTVAAANDKPAKAPKADKAAKAPKASPGDDAEITIKQVRAVFSKLIDTLGEDEGPKQGKKLLAKYNAKQIPDVEKEYFGNLIEDAESLIAEAANTAGDAGGDDDLGILGGDDDAE